MMVKLTKLALAAFVAVALLALSATADTYMMNPRGSNNRCDEQSNNRQNANRLFNSQNNAAGGYTVAPSLYHYVGSTLMVEWTSQHSCGTGNNACDMVFQYNCDNTMKDGETQDPEGDNGGNTCTGTPNAGNEDDANRGRHEDVNYFNDCNARQRNKGLFLADRQNNLNNGAGAQATRQNNGGGTSGFECQEERDYWPYWHPTPWRDVAVLTNNASLCAEMTSESQNVKAKNWCTTAAHNNKADCEDSGANWRNDNDAGAGNVGRMGAAFGIEKPECLEAPWTRDNSLSGGNTRFAGFMSNFNWTIPDTPGQNCVFRMRYNISTSDYDGRNTFANENGDQSRVQDDPYMQFGDMKLRLAINTAQFGRTFQDRSHTFEIRERPSWLRRGVNILNLNVRGKRGNIQQVRNCVEYDFTPQLVHVLVGDYIHFQWTGSNHNNAGNAGEGRNRWDRSNLVTMLGSLVGGNKFEAFDGPGQLFDDPETRYRFAFIGQEDCDPDPEGTNNDQAKNNCAKLNAAKDANGVSTGYFDGGLQKMNRTGVHHFMSTRNNNFTNRGQKGVIIVTTLFQKYLLFILLAIAGVVGVVLVAALAVVGVTVASGAGATGLFSGLGAKASKARASTRYRRQGSRRSMASGSSHGSARSKGSSRSKSSFGGSMI